MKAEQPSRLSGRAAGSVSIKIIINVVLAFVSAPNGLTGDAAGASKGADWDGWYMWEDNAKQSGLDKHMI